MIPKITLQRLDAARAHVDREVVLSALFRLMRGKPVNGAIDGGRYAFLWQAIRDEAGLLDDLARGRSAAWQPVIRKRCEQDADFLRGIALLYWEWALEFEAGEDAALATSFHERARYYWAHLLGRQGYWSALQAVDAPAAARPPAGAPAPAAKPGRDYGMEARGRVRDALLDHHLRRCRDHFHRFSNSSGREREAALKAARSHLGLLCGWDLLAGDVKPVEPLLQQEWDREALADVDRKSQELVGGWVSEWLTAANRRLDDRQVELPHGISKNFAGALESVRPCLDLVSVRPALFQRVLLFFLKQSFEWCVETVNAESRQRGYKILIGAEDALKQLVAVTPKPNAKSVLTDEQVTIARVYDALAKLDEDLARSVTLAKQALVWRPGDKDTKHLVANCECNLGISIANNGDNLGALPHIEAAQKLDPDNAWIAQQLATLHRNLGY